MGKGWEESKRQGRRDRIRQEVRHRAGNGPPPVPVDYSGCDGTHASYYRKGWDSVDIRDIVWQCQRYKEKTVFKTCEPYALKPALIRVLQSGWIIAGLTALSLLIMYPHGLRAFLVWFCALSGTLLLGFSIFLEGLAYRVVRPRMHIIRHAHFWFTLFWALGMVVLGASPLFASFKSLIWLDPLGALTGLLLCLWVSRKELLAWIQ